MISQNLLQRVSQLGKSWRGAFGETSKGSEGVCFAKREAEVIHRDDAVAVLHPSIPGAQPHALLPELGAHTGL